MATTIVLKNSVTTTNTPSSLAQGEVAINVTDKKVWVGNAATTPIQIVNGGPDGVFTSVTDSGLTNTRVTYAGAGGLLKDSASITTDGTTITAAFSGAHNGTVGATTPAAGTFTTLTGTNFNSASTFGFKNRLINGNMAIDQRNAGASSTSSNAYTVDRWAYYGSQASKGTWGQNLNSVTPPVGFNYYLGFQSSSAYSVVAADQFEFYQRIEGFNTADLGWGTANSKTVTLSFQVYSSLTGTFGGALGNSAQSYSYPFTYSIPVANTWTTISVTIAGPTAGTWVGATNGIGIAVYFGLGVGSTASGTAGAWAAANYLSATGATSVVGTNGATFYITGVQLEVGSQATSFDFRSYGTELALCQRYCFTNANGQWGTTIDTTRGIISVKFAVTMRTAATFFFVSGSTCAVDIIGGARNATVAANGGDANVSALLVGGMTGLTQYQTYGFTGSNQGFSAEL